MLNGKHFSQCNELAASMSCACRVLCAVLTAASDLQAHTVCNSFIIAVEMPGSENKKTVAHGDWYSALQALLVPSDGELHCSTLVAVCSDMDGDAAIAK